MAARFGDDVVDHHTYVIASDGDLMEGISHEAISIAGHLRLNKLIVLFDDNGISIDGPLSLSESGDQVARFEAAGWNASRIDGHEPGRDRRGDRGGAEERPADDDRLQDDHRLRRADQGRQVVLARLAARRRGDRRRAQGARLGLPALRDPGRHPRRLAHRRPASASQRPQGVGEAPRRGRPRRSAASSSGASAATCRPASTRRSPTTRRSSPPTSPKVATRKSSEMALDVINAGRAGDDRRLGRPHRLEQHPLQGPEGRHAGRLRRPLHPLGRARARHGARR